jgi:hypothetical protein
LRFQAQIATFGLFGHSVTAISESKMHVRHLRHFSSFHRPLRRRPRSERPIPGKRIAHEVHQEPALSTSKEPALSTSQEPALSTSKGHEVRTVDRARVHTMPCLGEILELGPIASSPPAVFAQKRGELKKLKKLKSKSQGGCECTLTVNQSNFRTFRTSLPKARLCQTSKYPQKSPSSLLLPTTFSPQVPAQEFELRQLPSFAHHQFGLPTKSAKSLP